jgi:hypothetical protein
MKNNKIFALAIISVILLSACEPVLHETNLQTEEKPEVPAVEPSPSAINVSDSQDMSEGVHGFGKGSSTNLRVPDIDQAYSDMADMGVRFIRKKIPMADVQLGQNFYDFNARWDLDRMIPVAEKYDLEIVGLLAYGPSLPYDDNEHFLRLWEGYVQAVIDRCGHNIH